MIACKRDGGAWSREEIGAIVRAVCNDGLDGCQLGALLMAAYLRGLDREETVALTQAMAGSGERLTWDRCDLLGPVVDKHSTGGVGDLVSLVLGPVLAACGCHVPMISGRALGLMGGTLDKLEAIPGLTTKASLEALRKQVIDVGIAIVGPTEDLVPGDRVLYAARDLTATVTSVPLIAASILSKKLAEGLDVLGLDVKYGRGAVFASRDEASVLADTMAEVAADAGLRTVVSLNAMDQPLAPVAGNALEVEQALACLRGDGSARRLDELIRSLSVRILAAAGIEGAADRVAQVLDDGTAAEVFGRMVHAQGGPARLLERSAELLPRAPVVRAVLAPRQGVIEAVDARAVGRAVVKLGGGRRRAAEAVDPAVGIAGLPSIGDHVEAGQPIAEIHAQTEDDAVATAAALAGFIRIGDPP